MIEKNKETNKYHAIYAPAAKPDTRWIMTIISSVLIADRRLIGVMNMTLEEKINRLRAAEKRLRKHLSEDEFGAVRRTAEGFGQEADWLEELKRYRDLEEQGRLLVLHCKVGKYEKRLVDLEKAMDKSTLYDWYVTSVVQKDTPVWTEEHIEELLNDFYVIPKEAELEKRGCEADGD